MIYDYDNSLKWIWKEPLEFIILDLRKYYWFSKKDIDELTIEELDIAIYKMKIDKQNDLQRFNIL